MNRLLIIAVLVLNGVTYWIPCEQGGVWCPHFDPPALEVLVSSGTVYVAYEPAPSTVVKELYE